MFNKVADIICNEIRSRIENSEGICAEIKSQLELAQNYKCLWWRTNSELEEANERAAQYLAEVTKLQNELNSVQSRLDKHEPMIKYQEKLVAMACSVEGSGHNVEGPWGTKPFTVKPIVLETAPVAPCTCGKASILPCPFHRGY